MQVSKETRQLAAEAFRDKVEKLRIKTAEQAIQWAHEFGPRLTYLDITGIPFSKERLSELLPRVPNLKTFIAYNCKIDSEGVKIIAHSPHLKNLQKLDLSYNPFTLEGVQELFHSKTIDQLQKLGLSHVNMGETGAKTLANSPNLSQLHTLILENCYIGNQGIAHLVGSEILKSGGSVATP